MKNLRTYVILWAFGWVAGVIAVERWRRVGSSYLPVAASAPIATETDTASSKPKVTAVIVSGAKADYDRVRRLVTRSATTSTTAP